MSREIAMPFHIDTTGGIAFTADPARITQQHVVAAIGTNPGERVMRPTYGTETVRFNWAAMGPMELDDLRESITTSVARLVEEVTVTSVDLVPDYGQGKLNVTVHYALASGLEGSAKASVDAAGLGSDNEGDS